MTGWCETCGQLLPESADGHTSTWLHAPDDGPDRRPTNSPKRAGDRRTLLVIGAIIAAWGLFVVVSRAVAPTEPVASPPADEQPEPEATPGPVPTETPPEVPTAVASENGESGDLGETTDPEPEATEPLAPTTSAVQVEQMIRQFERRQVAVDLAFRGPDGIALIDLRQGSAEVLSFTDGVTRVTPALQLLRSGRDTFGIDPETFAVAHVVDDSSMLVSTAGDGTVFYVAAASLSSGLPRVEVSTSDGQTSNYLVPAAYHLLPLDGLGLLAVAQGPSGGTLIAGQDGFEPLSDHRVLTANQAAMLEQVCATPIQCSLVVTEFGGGSQWTVPDSFGQLGDMYLLSPDGLSLLRITPEGFAEVLLSSDQSVLWVIGSGMEAPVWGARFRLRCLARPGRPADAQVRVDR